MTRKSTKALQIVEQTFQIHDQIYTREIQIKWEREGTRPGKFLIEGAQFEFGGVEVKVAACRHNDIVKLLELYKKSVEGKVSWEELDFKIYFPKKYLNVLNEVTPCLEYIARGWTGCLQLEPHLIYLARNSRGTYYKASDLSGTNPKVVTAERAEMILREHYLISLEQLDELKEASKKMVKDLANSFKTSYTTFRQEHDALVENFLRQLAIADVVEEEHITIDTIFAKYIK